MLNALFKSILILSLGGFFWSFESYSNTADEWTPGYQALKFQRRNNVWSQLDLMIFDGSVTTNPPGVTRHDRRLQATFNTGADYALAKGGVRGSLKAFGSFEKSEEDQEPKVPINQFIKRIQPAFDFTFINPKGLEIFMGVQLHHEFAYDRIIASDLINQTASFSEISLNVFRFGMMRRGGSWNGGFYYVNGASGKRDVNIKVEGISDELQTTESVQVAPEVGIIASFNLSGFASELDLAMIQASESPDLSADGISVVDDYLKIRFGSYIPIGIGTIYAGITHQTLSYSSNAFVTLDTIPRTLLKAKFLLGGMDSNLFVGGMYSFGDDGLSIPETNETFELDTVGVTTGFYLSF
jgi:hypothetical protein